MSTNEDQEQPGTSHAESAKNCSLVEQDAPDQNPPTDQTSHPSTKKQNLFTRCYDVLCGYKTKSLLTNPMAWLEVAALVAVICYTRYAGQQVSTMNQTLDEVKKQTVKIMESADAAKDAADTSRNSLELTQRAYLTIGRAQEAMSGVVGDQLKIPVENYGHIPTSEISVSLTYLIVRVNDAKFFEKRDTKISEKRVIIPGPGEDYAIFVTLPKLSSETSAAIESGQQVRSVIGKIEYNTGFGGKDTVSICISYNQRTREWPRCGAGTDIDFSKAAKHSQ